MSQQNNHFTAQSGGALIYVFIGIALFALLAFTFSKSFNSTSTSTLTAGQAKVASSQIISYTAGLQKSVQKLILKGCSEEEISFENPVETGYINGDAPSDESCHVFSQAGGKMTWKEPPPGVNDGSTWMFVGGPVLHDADGEHSTYTSGDADLVVYLFSLTEEACRQINASQGVEGIPVDSSNVAAVKFTGTFTAQENITGLLGSSQPSPCASSPAEPNMCGKSAACFQEEDAGQRYVFVSKLYSR